MRHLAIDVGSFRFVVCMAGGSRCAWKKTCAASRRVGSLSNQGDPPRWSGEAVWVLGEFDTGLGFENHTTTARGDLLLYPRGLRDRDPLRLAAAASASKLGHSSPANHSHCTVVAPSSSTRWATVLWKGRSGIRFTDLRRG